MRTTLSVFVMILLLVVAVSAQPGPGQPQVGTNFEVTSPTAPTGQHAGIVEFVTAHVDAQGDQTGKMMYQDHRTGTITTIDYKWWRDGAGVGHMTVDWGGGWHFFTWTGGNYWKGHARLGPALPWDVPDLPLPPSIRDLIPFDPTMAMAAAAPAPDVTAAYVNASSTEGFVVTYDSSGGVATMKRYTRPNVSSEWVEQDTTVNPDPDPRPFDGLYWNVITGHTYIFWLIPGTGTAWIGDPFIPGDGDFYEGNGPALPQPRD